MLTERTFNTGEVTINYAEGADNGAPIILLHGATMWWHNWDKLIPELTPSWHLYAPDLRGHGKSGRDGDHYLLIDYAKDIVAFLHERVDKPAVLVGHSLGALTAIATATQAQDCVRALVLLDPPLFIRDNPVDLMPDVKDWFEMAYQLTSTVNSREELEAILRSHFVKTDEAEIQMQVDMIYGIAPESLKVHLSNRLMSGFDLSAALEQITCPTLILQADWDCGGAMRDEDADYALSHLPHASVIKLVGIDHMLTTDYAETTWQHIQPFLQSLG